jgi:hypothetical protein
MPVDDQIPAVFDEKAEFKRVSDALRDRGLTLREWSLANKFDDCTARKAIMQQSNGKVSRHIRRRLAKFMADKPILE